MFPYRQVLVRLRAGDAVREIARSGLMGRDKLGELRAVAQSLGWLDAGAQLPDDQTIVAALGPGRRASSTVSSVEPHRAAVKAWLHAGVQGRAIHAALKREHAYTGSYSAVVRMLRQLREQIPPEVTVRLSFAPAEAAQVNDPCVGRAFPITVATAEGGGVTIELKASTEVSGCRDRKASLTLGPTGDLAGKLDNGNDIRLSR